MQSNTSGAILIDGLAFPSVSKILVSDPKRKTFYKSRGAKRKQGSLDSDSVSTGRHRGESLHEAFAQFITTGECDVPEIYLPYWDNLYSFISPLNIQPVWAEKPLLPEHQHFTSGETSVIWSTKDKFLGKPDLIGNIEGVNAVVEIKTSRTPYSKSFDHRKFIAYGEFYSYAHSAMQVAAYTKAWTERTKQKIDVGIVINVMPDGLQFFTVEYPEMQLRLKNFRALAREYHKVH